MSFPDELPLAASLEPSPSGLCGWSDSVTPAHAWPGPSTAARPRESHARSLQSAGRDVCLTPWLGATQQPQEHDSVTAWLASARRVCPPRMLWCPRGDAGRGQSCSIPRRARPGRPATSTVLRSHGQVAQTRGHIRVSFGMQARSVGKS